MLHSHLSENLAMSSFLYVLTIYIFLYNKLAKKEVASSDVATKDHQDSMTFNFFTRGEKWEVQHFPQPMRGQDSSD